LETFAYSASKAAVHQLTRVLAHNLSSKSITVNAIAAGPFPSKMMKSTLEAFEEIILSGLALPRVGAPDDVGGLCIFLSSRASSWMTGAIIPLDGGALIKAKI
jgi:NAD(P)-dependent dehydrogenase (short-subunit alcohol dehydrogenase family)